MGLGRAQGQCFPRALFRVNVYKLTLNPRPPTGKVCRCRAVDSGSLNLSPEPKTLNPEP